jgi:hypothetical protein
MTMNRLLTASALAALLAGPAWADSAKLTWTGNRHAYQRFNIPLKWTDAKAYCSGLDGHLATLTSQAENDWVWNNLGVNGIDIWLGGTDEAHEGFWTWVTGEPWGYANWSPGQPDNSGGSENYSVFIFKQLHVKYLRSWFDRLTTNANIWFL